LAHERFWKEAHNRRDNVGLGGKKSFALLFEIGEPNIANFGWNRRPPF
jgi:hypothetical protein